MKKKRYKVKPENIKKIKLYLLNTQRNGVKQDTNNNTSK